MQFLSDKFSFDGLTSDDMNVCLITFDDDIIKDFGNVYQQDVSGEGSLNGEILYSVGATSKDDIPLNIMLVDELGTQKPWTQTDLQRVIYWLTTDTFKPFVSEDNADLTYYIMCTSINKKMTTNMTGYLECTFKFFGDCAYLRHSRKVVVNGSAKLNIANASNVREVCKPLTKIKNLGTASTVNTISVNGKTFEISGLNTNEEVTIDHRMCTVFNTNKENVISKCNRKWLGFNLGDNMVSCSGNCEITLLADFKVRV